ncbi:MAG TPA: hypothetical protein VFU48_05530 [Nitrospira sp.]|nr:hypothetical protein [Nitrospira sp.]
MSVKPNSLVRGIRAKTEEWKRWSRAADLADLKLNTWAVRSLNRVAELEASLARQSAGEDLYGTRPGETLSAD